MVLTGLQPKGAFMGPRGTLSIGYISICKNLLECAHTKLNNTLKMCALSLCVLYCCVSYPNFFKNLKK